MEYNSISVEISQLADVFAIPFFALLAYYFYQKDKRTDIENVLFFFAVVGLVADVLFTGLYFSKRKIIVGFL